jgi:hypothetical protein
MAAEQQFSLVRPGRRWRHGDLDGCPGRATARVPGQGGSAGGGRRLNRNVAVSG